MMKNFFPRLAWCAILLLAICSCSTKEEYTAAIPADAALVMGLNLQSLADKAGVNDAENQALLQQATDALKQGMDAATVQHLETLLKDPSRSGIDVNAPVYAFLGAFITNPTLSVVAKVKSESDLTALLETLAKNGLCSDPEQGDGFRYVKLDTHTLLAYNATTLLVQPYDKYVDKGIEIAKLKMAESLKQSTGEGIVSTPAFTKLQAMQADFGMLVNMEGIMGGNLAMINSADAAVNKEYIELMSKMRMVAGLTFEQGKIRISYEQVAGSDELQKLFDEQGKGTPVLQNKYLEVFPKNTLALLSMGMNGEAMYQQLMMVYGKMLQAEANPYAKEIEQLLSAFTQDITIGVLDMQGMMPTILGLADVKDASFLDALYARKGEFPQSYGDAIVKTGENEYAFKSGMMNLYFGVRDQVFCITNSEPLFKEMKKANPSVKEAAYADYFKGAKVVFAVNATAVFDLPLVKMATQYLSSPDAKLVVAMLQQVDYLVGHASDNQKGELVLQLKDADTNALKQIQQFVRGAFLGAN
jgi:hypothetical protein